MIEMKNGDTTIKVLAQSYTAMIAKGWQLVNPDDAPVVEQMEDLPIDFSAPEEPIEEPVEEVITDGNP